MMVTALGMMTSVGSDAFAACASIRAGLARPKPLDDFSIGNMEDMSDGFPLGHPVTGQTDGFVLWGRWFRLLDGAIESLWATSQIPGPEEDDSSLREAASRQFCGPVPLQGSTILASGRVALVPALRMAREMIVTRRCARVLVAAVDSYLDPLTIDWLWGAERLKLPSTPAGLSPGEAGACLLVEAEWAARERGAHAILHVRGLGEAEDPDVHDRRPTVGRGLAEAVLSSLKEAGIAEVFSGDVVSDHNGESWRAMEYGGARALLKPRLSMNLREVFPAQSIGDVGAASAAVALCVAGRSFVRGYSSSQ